MERLSLLYASALFDLALEQDAFDVFLEQASYIHSCLNTPECRKVLAHPHISDAEKHEFFRKSFEGHIHEDLLGFLFLTADKNREAFLVPALAALIDMIKRHNRIVTAKVLAAAPLDDTQTEELKTMLSEKLHKTIELSLKIDPSVIGGPYIFVDGYYIDWTVKKRLRDLTFRMKEGCSA